MTTISTYTGEMFDLTDPTPEHIELAHIAHALSLLCRWGGSCRRFYSVAEHSVRVSYEAEALARESVEVIPQRLIKRIAFEGLMHDAEEAYPPGDILAPLKHAVRGATGNGTDAMLIVQRRIRLAVEKRFGLHDELPAIVHRADLIMLRTEGRDLMDHVEWSDDLYEVEPQRHELRLTWTATQAELAFLARFQELSTTSVLPAIERLLPERWRDAGPEPAENRYPPTTQRDDATIMRILLRELDRHRHAIAD